MIEKKGIVHIAYDMENKVAIRQNSEWKKDNSFFPFFYVKGDTNIPILSTYKRLSVIKDFELESKYILWDIPRKPRKFFKVTVKTPMSVSNVANTLSEKHNLPVFSSDIPYLTNYLLNKKINIYDGIREMRAVIFDVECDIKYSIPFLIGSRFGKVNLNTFKFEDSEDIVYEKTAVDNVTEFFTDIQKRNIDLAIGHNIGFDWQVVANYSRLSGIKPPKLKQVKVFQGQFHGSEYFYPTYIQNFCTLLGLGIAFPRPISHELKYIVSHLKLRGTKDRTYINKRRIYDEFKINRNNAIKYNLDDINDTQLLFEYMAPSIFIPAIVSGETVESVILSGIKAIWEMLMMRRCVNENILIPHFENKALDREKSFVNPFLKKQLDLGKAKGGLISEVSPKYLYKVFKNVYNVDITADFPNITLQYNISPETVFRTAKNNPDSPNNSIDLEFERGIIPVSLVHDCPGILPSVLKEINDECIELKKRKKVDSSLVPRYKGFKSIRDSHYSVSATVRGQSRFSNRYSLALVHHYGRKLLEDIISGLKKANYIVIYPDTDGVLTYTNEVVTENSNDIFTVVKNIEKDLVREYGSRFGEDEGTGIDIEVYDSLFILSAKNYIYKMKDEIVIKGILGSRSLCALERRSIEKFFYSLFTEGVLGAKKTLKEIKDTILECEEPTDFAFNVFLKKEKAYTNKNMLSLVEKLGAGNSLVFVRKGASKTAKPYGYFEMIDNFSENKVDKEWYWWHFKNYLLREVCKIDLNQEKLF